MSGGLLNNGSGRTFVGQGANTTALIELGGTSEYRNNGSDFFALGDTNGTDPSKAKINVIGGALNTLDMAVGGTFDGGNAGSGTLTVSSGTVTTRGLQIGRNAGSLGITSVTGGSITTTSNVSIGESGTGILTVDGAGASVTSGDQLFVGNNGGAVGTMNINAGTVSANSWIAIGRTGATGTVTVSGTGVLQQNNPGNGYLEMTNSSSGGSAVLNLNGGSVIVNGIVGSGGANGTAVINFNGGTLKPTMDNGNFINVDGSEALTLNVQAGGAVFDTNGKTISLNRALAGNAGDGGLTKNGTGTLVLTQTTGYTGTTTVNAGTLQANVGGTVGTIGGDGAIVVNNGGNLQSSSTDALGYFNHTSANILTINAGGTLTAGDSSRISMDRILNVVGGTVASVGTNFDNGASYSFRDAGGSGGNGNGALNSYNFTSAVSGVAATISATHIGLGGNTTFNVTDGPGLVDLNVTGDFVDNFGTGSLIKSGDGVMSVLSVSTYNGATSINAGRFVLEGSGVLQNTNGVSVSANAVLQVDGVINSSATTMVAGSLNGNGTLGVVNVVSGGSIGAGDSIGTLNTGALSLSSGSTFQLEIAIATPSSFTTDLTNVAGNLSLGDSTLSLSDPAGLGGSNFAINLTAGSVITFLDYSGVWDGSIFAGHPDDSIFTVGADTFRISYNGVNNADSAVILEVQAVPEPGAGVALVSGLGLLASLRSFRRRH